MSTHGLMYTILLHIGIIQGEYAWFDVYYITTHWYDTR